MQHCNYQYHGHHSHVVRIFVFGVIVSIVALIVGMVLHAIGAFSGVVTIDLVVVYKPLVVVIIVGLLTNAIGLKNNPPLLVQVTEPLVHFFDGVPAIAIDHHLCQYCHRGHRLPRS